MRSRGQAVGCGSAGRTLPVGLAGWLCLAAACAPSRPAAPLDPASPRIVLDGELADWAGIPTLITDPGPDDATRGIGLVSLQAWDDPSWLYLALETEEPLNLQSLPGTIQLFLDIDGEATTGLGGRVHPGAEIVLDMSLRPDGTDREHGAGFGLRVVGEVDEVDGWATAQTRNPYDVQVTALPTHSANRFELRLARRIPAVGSAAERAAVAPVGASTLVLDTLVRVAVAALAPDSARRVVDVLEPTNYRLRTAPGPDPFEPTLAPLRTRVPGSLRVATWNVSEGRFRTPTDHARMLGAVAPDVVLLDEVFGEIDDAALADFFEHPALARLGEWRWVVSRGGGRQKTVVAARDREIRPEATMREVRYAPGALEGLRRQMDSTFYPALAYEARVNLSATGAWVAMAPGVEALFVPMDLQSGGYDGSPRDVLRLLQAGTIKRHVVRAVAARMQEGPVRGAEGEEGSGSSGSAPWGSGSEGREEFASLRPDSSPVLTGLESPPVVLGGDLNLVGSRAPLELLLAHGRDPYGPLEAAHLPRLDEATLATWRSPRQALFGPGRLDYTLYSRETLEQVGGFVFAVDGLTDAQLDELGLDRELAGTVSDHLIMVTDLRLKSSSD